MSKRRADFQLDRDGHHKAIEEELERKAQEDKFSASQLSSSNTSGRKIAKLRKPLNKAPAPTPATEQPAVNVFANLMKHSNKFSSVLLPEPSEEVEKMTKFKAINFNFSQKITESIKEDPQCNLTKACEKYLEYAKQALSGTASATPEHKEAPPVKETPFKNFKPQLSKPVVAPNNTFEQLKKLKPSSEKPSITELPTSDEEADKPEIKGPQFTLTSNPVAKKPAFVFGEALAKKQAAEVHSDDSDIAEQPKGPSFTFGGKVEDPVFKIGKKEEESKPAFSSVLPNGKNDPVATKAPAFSFNLGNSDKKEVKLPSIFKNNETKPDEPSTFTFNLDNKKTEDKPAATSLFNFGAKDDKPKAIPSFSFGKPAEAESKPASTFSFNKPAENEPKPAPTFSFGKPAETKTEPASTFSFGKPQPSTTEKPGAFGATTSFSFGKKEETTEAPSSQPTSNFKFALPFNLGTATEAPTQTAAPADNDEEEKQEQLKLENDEESTENLLYTQKAQLKVYQPENKESPYITKGVGMFKILQSKEDSKKYRFLLRTEGMGNIILNTYIIAGVKYEQIPQRKKVVKMPIFNPETKKIETHLLSVKTEDDASEIIKVIKDAQANMN